MCLTRPHSIHKLVFLNILFIYLDISRQTWCYIYVNQSSRFGGVLRIFVSENVSCILLLEPCSYNSSDEWSQHTFYEKISKMSLKLSQIPLLIWSSVIWSLPVFYFYFRSSVLSVFFYRMENIKLFFICISLYWAVSRNKCQL